MKDESRPFRIHPSSLVSVADNDLPRLPQRELRGLPAGRVGRSLRRRGQRHDRQASSLPAISATVRPDEEERQHEREDPKAEEIAQPIDECRPDNGSETHPASKLTGRSDDKSATRPGRPYPFAAQAAER